MKNYSNKNSGEKKYSLSFVLPLYNEEENVAPCVFSCLEFARRHCSFYEIIMVNDGSIDKTDRICQNLLGLNPRLRLIHHPRNLGIGAALHSGFQAAQGEYIFYMDGDNQFDVFGLKEFLPYLDGYDLLLGWRLQRADAAPRKINAWLYKTALRTLLGLRFKDIDCGFKVFARKILQKQSLKSRGAFFIAEFLHRMKKMGVRAKEIPVSHYPRVYGSQTGAHPKVIFKAALEMLAYLAKRE